MRAASHTQRGSPAASPKALEASKSAALESDLGLATLDGTSLPRPVSEAGDKQVPEVIQALADYPARHVPVLGVSFKFSDFAMTRKLAEIFAETQECGPYSKRPEAIARVVRQLENNAEQFEKWLDGDTLPFPITHLPRQARFLLTFLDGQLAALPGPRRRSESPYSKACTEKTLELPSLVRAQAEQWAELLECGAQGVQLKAELQDSLSVDLARKAAMLASWYIEAADVHAILPKFLDVLFSKQLKLSMISSRKEQVITCILAPEEVPLADPVNPVQQVNALPAWGERLGKALETHAQRGYSSGTDMQEICGALKEGIAAAGERDSLRAVLEALHPKFEAMLRAGQVARESISSECTLRLTELCLLAAAHEYTKVCVEASAVQTKRPQYWSAELAVHLSRLLQLAEAAPETETRKAQLLVTEQFLQRLSCPSGSEAFGRLRELDPRNAKVRPLHTFVDQIVRTEQGRDLTGLVESLVSLSKTASARNFSTAFTPLLDALGKHVTTLRAEFV